MAGASRKKETMEQTKKTGRAGGKERAGKAESRGKNAGTKGAAGREKNAGTGDTAGRGKNAGTGDTAGRGKNAGSGDMAGRGKSAGTGQAAGSRKKAGTQKDSSSRQTGSGRRRAEEYEQEKENFMGTEVAIIVTFAVSVLLFLSNFGLCGTVGNFCRGVMLGIFGTAGYLAPVLFFIGICFYLSNRGNIRAVIKLAAVGILLLAICGLDQMLFGGGMRESWTLGQYYTESGASGNGGGLLGGLMVVALCSSVGKVGAYVVLLVALAVAAVCITEKSLVNFVKRGSGRAYEYAREDMSRRRELHEERKEEKRRLREEQRVKGVDLGSATLQNAPSMREFVSGIPEGMMLSPEEDAAVPGTEQPMVSAEQEYMAEERSMPIGQEAAAEQPGMPTGFSSAAEAARQIRSGSAQKATVNPADIFRGKIQMPRQMAEQPEEEQVDQEELRQAELRQERSGQAELRQEEPRQTESGQEEPKIPEETDSDQLLKRIYVRRDTRTVAELSGGEMGAGAKQGPGYYPVHTEPAVSWPDPPVIMEEDDSEYPAAPDEEWIETQIVADEEWIETQSVAEDDWIDTSKDLPDETGVNYDSFYIPEEPKTVVTASGKVIDTDTELVRKTLEKKREERKQLPDSELSVSEQIEKKTEAEKVVKKEYVFPPIHLLKRGDGNQNGFSEQEYKDTAIKLQQTLQNFGVGVTVTNISCGPSVTRYELQPEQGVKVSKIVSLADDIKLNLAASDIRIEAPIPGKAAVGIEVPNKENTVVFLRELLESEDFKRHSSRMAFAVGKDIGGQVVVSDIARMPHLLIAGATGSGKSVCINTLIMSIIYKAKPEEVKLIMIDPKVVELSVYNGIPHLLIPVVTDPKKASGALNWAVAEMMDRYAKFAKYNVRDLKGFNAKVDSIQDIEDDRKPEKLPQIIIIVDELADLMMVAPGEVEDAICRLAQLARAAGIHLVIATQRPSVNVITGVIKANIPSRIAFSVSSGVDSRTIIDMHGAEKLLGKGDMLFYPSGYQKPQRVQGAFVSDQEVSAVVDFLTEQGMTAEYSPEVESRIRTAAAADSGSGGGERDAYFVQAGRFIIEKEKASIGMLQRMFKIGFNRAARIMDQLADAGVVGEEEGTKPRKVLMSMEQFEAMLNESV